MLFNTNLGGRVQGHQRHGRHGRRRAAHVDHQTAAAGQHAGQDQTARVHGRGDVASDGRVRVVAKLRGELTTAVARHTGEVLGVRVTDTRAVDQHAHAAGSRTVVDHGPEPRVPSGASPSGPRWRVVVDEPVAITRVAHVLIVVVVVFDRLPIVGHHGVRRPGGMARTSATRHGIFRKVGHHRRHPPATVTAFVPYAPVSIIGPGVKSLRADNVVVDQLSYSTLEFLLPTLERPTRAY